MTTEKPSLDLFAITPLLLVGMRKESFDLQRQINQTPKWRRLKRYRLLERLYKLDEDRALISHVMMDDEGY